MVLKRITRWCGRRVGWGMRSSWDIFKGIVKWFSLLLIVIIGMMIAAAGQIILLILGGLLAICILFLKGFAWLTYRLMVTTKWFGSQVNEFTETFFNGVMDTFSQEEDFLNREVHLLINIEKE